MSAEAFIKSITQKCSASVKDPELFNDDCSKWKWFKQAVNNKLYCNTDHYSNYDDKIDYIDFYVNDKVNCILNYKWNSNNYLNFKTYSDLPSFFDKYYQDHLQDENDMKEWEAFCIKHDDQFPVFWVKFTTLACKVEVFFFIICSLSVYSLRLWHYLH